MKTLIIALGSLFISSSLAQSPNLRSSNPKERVLTDASGCWIEAYGRGVGNAVSVCPSGQQYSNGLCYPNCASGYTGVGPVCWQTCPSGFSDTGAYCQKPSSYGRGSGYAIWSQGQCQNDNPQGCEQYGALWYPICASGYYAAGCCVCSPYCPGGMTDIGVSCQKLSYGRGVGKPLGCPATQDTDAGLCYNKCRSGWAGSGPVCWGSCPSGQYKCGALCLPNQAACTSTIQKVALEVVQGVLEVAADIENPVGVVISLAQTGVQVGSDLAQYGLCTNL